MCSSFYVLCTEMNYPSHQFRFLHPSQVVGVAQAINKKCGEDGAFTEQDEKVSKAHNLARTKF